MTEYRYVTKPYKHQRRALRQLLRQGYGGALLMEPRTGKTKTTVDWLGCLQVMGKIDRAIVVAPNRVMDVWVRELLKESPLKVHITVWDAKERKLGPPRTPPGYDLYVVIVNYEAFATPGKKTKSGRRSKSSGRFKNRANLRRWKAGKPAALVLDESHKIKSASGAAANMLVAFGAEFQYRAILTGTPITKAKRPHDVYMQWSFLNPERFKDLPTVADFKAHYGRWTNANGYPQFLAPRNLTDLHRRMAADAFIVRRDQCFDLPPREDLVEYVDLVRSRSAYEQMAEEMIAKLEDGSIAEASVAVVQSLRLRQLTSGFVTDEDGEVKRVGFEKYDKLIDILEDWVIEREQKVVVAALWKPDMDLIQAYADERKIINYSIRGGVKRKDSDQFIKEFREKDEPAIMIVQPSAASLGIDLSSAAHMIWYSHTPSWVDFTQCCDRIALSRSSTTFTHIVARNSVDEVMLSTLAGDGDVGRAFMSNPGDLLDGHTLDLDDHSRLRGVGLFKYDHTKMKGKR